MNRWKIIAGVLVTAVLSSVLTLFGLAYMIGINTDSVGNIMRFIGARRYIEANYVNDVDDTKLINGAISGMVQSLGDPHSIYLDSDLFKKLHESTTGEFGGIGIYMGFKDGVKIISVIEGTPSESAGLKAGDSIIAVNGTPISEIQPEEVAMNIRGEAGTTVTLTIHREGEEDKDYTIERGIIPVHSVVEKDLGDGYGYIRISNFNEHTGTEFKEALAKIDEAGQKGFILDLRQNPGGLVASCVEVANEIVPAGKIVTVIDKEGREKEYDSNLGETKYKIVVLIDGGSASASEILAGALQDTKAATIVGTKSYGKGSVQSVMPLFKEDGMKLTIAKYYTPSGRSIDGVGIEPDVLSELPANATEDTQLNKAKEILEGLGQ